MIESGRTIAGKREKAESDSERSRAKKYYKKKKITSFVIVLILGGILIFLALRAGIEFFRFISTRQEEEVEEISPTIEVVDDASSVSAKLSSRMREYIANFEIELNERGLKIIEAHIPVDTIREVDFYIEGVNGRFKTTIDRGIGVQAEDIVRMIEYLKNHNVENFEYVDVRVDRKAYWK